MEHCKYILLTIMKCVYFWKRSRAKIRVRTILTRTFNAKLKHWNRKLTTKQTNENKAMKHLNGIYTLESITAWSNATEMQLMENCKNISATIMKYIYFWKTARQKTIVRTILIRSFKRIKLILRIIFCLLLDCVINRLYRSSHCFAGIKRLIYSSQWFSGPTVQVSFEL